MAELISTSADKDVTYCIDTKRSFALIAGAGSGKTTSLITALKHIRVKYGANLLKNSQQVACITYTNRAVEVISSKLGHDDMYLVSTIHSFLWNEIKRFTHDIRDAINEHRIPQLIEKAREKDNGGSSKTAVKARKQIENLENELRKLKDVSSFIYDDSVYSAYSEGLLSHDDVIEVAGYLLMKSNLFRKVMGFRYPFIFVDEAQDTFQNIVEGFNLIGSGNGFPVIGYFGDPWQQIYDKRAGDFRPPVNGMTITKTENFRCSENVIAFLNAFRNDVIQYPAGKNKGTEGSVLLTLIQAENPDAPRGQYSEVQLERALRRLDTELEKWGWSEKDDIIKLFLVRQMIARRLGFLELNKKFTGKFASSRAQDAYESGDHFLLKPFLDLIWPIIKAKRNSNERLIIDLLRSNSPGFDIKGRNSERSLKEMVGLSKMLISDLNKMWDSNTIREIFEYCKKKELVRFSEQLVEHLTRKPREEDYNIDIHEGEKGDWLCDEFLSMRTGELQAYCEFIQDNTVYSTQHGVKGEEYPNILVVFDDVEAAWRNYSFTKLLTPNTSGQPTEGQFDRSKRLAYVCFSRAEVDLRILLFTLNPEAAKQEIIAQKLLAEENVHIVN